MNVRNIPRLSPRILGAFGRDKISFINIITIEILKIKIKFSNSDLKKLPDNSGFVSNFNCC